MPYTAITTEETEAGKPLDETLMAKIRNNFEYLFGQSGASGIYDIPNGSFEIDADADGIPDSWTRSLYPGGTGARNTSAAVHGSACVALTHPGGAGNGGGYFESDYVPRSSMQPEVVGMAIWNTVQGMKNRVIVRFFDSAKVDLSQDQTLLDTTATPTSARQHLMGFSVPAAARFYKLRLVGGYSDTNVAGTTYFDGVSRQPMVLRGLPGGNVSAGEASASGFGGTFVDVLSVVIHTPLTGLPVVLASLPVQGKWDSTPGGNVFTRLRCGTNEGPPAGVVLTGAYQNLTLSLGLAGTPPASGALTVVVQARCDSGAGNARYKIDSTPVSYRIDLSTAL